MAVDNSPAAVLQRAEWHTAELLKMLRQLDAHQLPVRLSLLADLESAKPAFDHIRGLINERETGRYDDGSNG